MPSRKYDTWTVIAIAWLVAILMMIFLWEALAREDGDWSATPAEVRQWFQTLMQPDYPNVSCCGESDAYEADAFEVEGDHYVAIITGWRVIGNIPIGTRIPVPNEKMKYDKGNPTGHGIIFIGVQGNVLCYVTPGGI